MGGAEEKARDNNWSVAEEIRVLRKDIEARMLQLNERIASISDSVKVSSQLILQSTMKSAGGVSHDPPSTCARQSRASF